MSLQAYIESLSPAAYYPFNSDTPLSQIGTTVIPRIWNKTIVGSGDGPKVPGAGDRYLGFRSSDLTYLSYPTMASFVNGATTNTVIAVIRRVTGNDAGATANNSVLWKTINSNSSGLQLNFPDAACLRVGGRSTSADAYLSVTGATPLPLDEWVLVVAEWGYTSKTIRLWLNGTLDAEATGVAFTSNTYVQGTSVRGDFIGTSNDSGTAEVFGSFDLQHLAFIKRALTQEERTNLSAAWNERPSVEGFVSDDTGTPCARVVRAYDRATGALLNSTTSNSVTGAYTLLTPTDAECSVVCLDDADGTIHNDLILRVTP